MRDTERFAEALAREEAMRDTTPAVETPPCDRCGDRPPVCQCYPCEVCGKPMMSGDWPCIKTIRPHGRALPSKGFEPRFDVGLGKYVTGWGDVRKAMRQEHLDFRDHPSKGEQSARRDRAHERAREADGRTE